MLRGRKGAICWLGPIVAGGATVCTVASAGNGDTFRERDYSTVAKVGGRAITIEQFRRTYVESLQQLTRQLGRPLTPERAAAIGVARRVLSDPLEEKALDQL